MVNVAEKIGGLFIHGSRPSEREDALSRSILTLSRKEKLNPDEECILATSFISKAMMGGRASFTEYCKHLNQELDDNQRWHVLQILSLASRNGDKVHFIGEHGVGTEPPVSVYKLVMDAFAQPVVSGTMTE